MEKELEKLQRQLAMAIKERRYARMAELQRKIAALQNVREHVPLSFLLPKFTPQERDKALVLMHHRYSYSLTCFMARRWSSRNILKDLIVP